MGSATGRRIGKALARLFMAERRSGDRPVIRPGCQYGLIVEERISDLAEDMASVKGWLRALVLAAFGGLLGLLVDIVVRVLF